VGSGQLLKVEPQVNGRVEPTHSEYQRTTMCDLSQQQQARIEKRDRLKALGVNPYPFRYERTHSIRSLLEQQEHLIETGSTIRLAGRLMAFRRQGKTAFCNLKEDQDRVQLYIAQKTLGVEGYDIFKCLDLGDFVGVEGNVFRTRTGELSLNVTGLAVLAKAIRPLPVPKEKTVDGEKVVFDEFRNQEQRYRQRYLDLVLNDSVTAVFRKRARIIRAIRDYLEDRGFIEVETPTLQRLYGGANAKPFETHHHSLDMKLYLRISNELFLKRCIIGGMERVYEIVKDFRNEGIDRTHNPEFTQVEFYQAYADYNDMMVHFENLYASACMAVNGSTRIRYQGVELDLTPPWQRLSLKNAIRRYAGFDVDALSDSDLKTLLKEKDIQLKGEYIRGLAIAELFEVFCEEHLIQPVFITDHPRETTPLCKIHRSDPMLVERFEPYINGWEVGNAYSELNDPELQKRFFQDQVERGRGGEAETHPMDDDFLAAMEYGMPPTGGIGLGIDRMVMLLTDQSTIRDVILFPLLRDL
jgi:lysyl-tRNA synthetase, class II